MKAVEEVMHIQIPLVQLHQLVIGIVQIDIGTTEVLVAVQLNIKHQLVLN